MKRKQEEMKRKKEVLRDINKRNKKFILVWDDFDEILRITPVIVPSYSAKEEYHLIANAANKFWELIDV